MRPKKGKRSDLTAVKRVAEAMLEKLQQGLRNRSLGDEVMPIDRYGKQKTKELK